MQTEELKNIYFSITKFLKHHPLKTEILIIQNERERFC